MIESIITIGIGIGIVTLGYLIWIKKMLYLIIGYSESTFYGDKEKYAKRIGLMVIILGVFVISVPFSIMIFGESVKQVYAFLSVTFVIIIGIIANYWRFRF